MPIWSGLFLCPASRLPELITELIKVKPVEAGRAVAGDRHRAGRCAQGAVDRRVAERAAGAADGRDARTVRCGRSVAGAGVGVRARGRDPGDRAAARRRRVAGRHPAGDRARQLAEAALRRAVSQENFPSVDEVADFLSVDQRRRRRRSRPPRACTTRSGTPTPRPASPTTGSSTCWSPPPRSPVAAGDVREALASTDGEALAAEAAGADRPGRARRARRVRLLRLVLADRPGRRPRGAGAAVSWIDDPAFAEGPAVRPADAALRRGRRGRRAAVAVRVGDHALPLRRSPSRSATLRRPGVRATPWTRCSPPAARPSGARCGPGCASW